MRILLLLGSFYGSVLSQWGFGMNPMSSYGLSAFGMGMNPVSSMMGYGGLGGINPYSMMGYGGMDYGTMTAMYGMGGMSGLGGIGGLGGMGGYGGSGYGMFNPGYGSGMLGATGGGCSSGCGNSAANNNNNNNNNYNSNLNQVNNGNTFSYRTMYGKKTAPSRYGYSGSSSYGNSMYNNYPSFSSMSSMGCSTGSCGGGYKAMSVKNVKAE